jgi:transposase, IS30 family
MERKYNHLTSEERDLIAVRNAEGKTQEEIASEIGRSVATVSRELRRNKSSKGLYLATEADKQARERKSKAHQRTRIPDKFIRQYIEDRIIQDQWTPEQISGRLKMEYPEHYVSHETIYQYIYNEKPELGLYLPRKRHQRLPKSKLRKTKGSKILDRVSIKERPPEIEKREEFGHFEADCVVSSRKGKGALLTMAERVSRYTIIAKLDEKTSSQTNLALSFALSKYPKGLVKSTTYDNGLEFAGHKEVNNVINMTSYFCEPYHSWEKGTIENRNGVIRYYFPKGTDFSKITEEQIKYVQDKINNRPMKLLGFKTPKEIHDKIVSECLQNQGFALAA